MDSFSKIKLFSVIAFSAFTFQNLSAQNTSDKENQLSVSFQMRPRAEFRSGTFRPLSKGEKPAALISQRTRVNINYQYKNLLTVQVSPQNVSVWGQDGLTQGAGIKNGVAFFEAWAKLNLSSSSSLQIGRQVISLDDERFFGELDWAQGARAHDAISFHLNKEKFSFKAYAAYNQNYKELYGNNLSNISGSLYSPLDATPYKWMQTLWAKFNFNSKSNLSLLFNNLGFQTAADLTDVNAKNYFQQTIGANYFYTSSDWKFNVSAYTQFGKTMAGAKTNAYLLAFFADRKLDKKWNLGLGTDYLSGNDVGTVGSQDNKAFNPYFGTNHKFYGSMDYFYAGNGHKGSGLVDIYAKASLKPTASTNFGFALHQFLSPNKIVDNNQNLSTNLGQEFDVDFGYAIHKYAKLVGGYSVFANTSSLNYLKNSVNPNSLQHWVWLSLNINPNIFNTKF
ncbi:MAG: alginate export family protein [Chitinophagales bacterium]|nr:alginate export family protein [Chitinophagales bacterium]